MVAPFPAAANTGVDVSCPIGLEVFCDWITLYQDHRGVQVDGKWQPLPVLNDGYVVRFGSESFMRSVDLATGEMRAVFDASLAEYTVSRRMEHKGSFDTQISVRCDGYRVELSGNVGRFGRRDNLFGLPVLETIERANAILKAWNLPAFTHNETNREHARDNAFHVSHNAVVTRVDLTANFAAGSREAAFRVLHWMSGQGTARNGGKSPRNYGNGITWNEGSKRHYEKLYYKADELGQHVTDEVRDYCESVGLLRYEVSLKSRQLARENLQSMVSWSKVQEGQRMENVIYGRFAQVLTRNQVSVMELHQIPGKLGMVAQSYLDGNNPYETARVDLRTRRRWRAGLLKQGLDIARPMDVTRMAYRVKLIELQPCSAPAWYSREAA